MAFFKKEETRTIKVEVDEINVESTIKQIHEATATLQKTIKESKDAKAQLERTIAKAEQLRRGRRGGW